MENNISNEEQIRNKFERIFQYENNKNAFLDYFYGKSNSCPTLRNYYGYDAEDIFRFYFDENTKEEDKKALSRYAEAIIKDIYKDKNVHIILRLSTGEDLEKALIESYNNTYERTIYDKKYSKATLANNEASKYIQIQVNNFYKFSELEAYVSKDFNKYLEKVKNDNKVLLNKEPHLLLTILVYLINRDDDKSLIKQLLNYIDSLKINDEETISLLFTIVDKDKEVYKRLMNILNKDNNMIYFLVNIYKDMTRTIKLYKRLFKGYSEDKGYYYYTQKLIPEYLELCNFPKECILLNTIVNNNTLFISYLTVEAKKLYDEDRETFYKLYEIIEKSKLEQLYLDYAMLSSIMLASGNNKYNIDTNSIVETLKTMCVELLKIMQPIQSFDEITSKSFKYVKENNYDSHSHYLSAIMSLDGINDEASEITTKLLKHYGIYGKISIYVSIQEIFYNRGILETKEKLVNDKKVPLKDIYLSLLDSKDNIITLIKNNAEETKSIMEEKSFITSITANISGTISFINCIFSDELNELIDNKFDFVFKVLDTAKSKEIKKHCVSVISNNESIVRSEVEKLANEGKEASRTVYKEIIKYWDLQKFDDDFQFKSVDEINEYLNKYYNEGHESLIKDIDENILSNILLKDKKTKAPLNIVKYVFMEYIALKEPSILKDCNKIAEFFDIDSLRNALDDIYSNWLDNKADTKLKNILIPYCIFQPEDKLLKLKTQIEEWALNSRGALAAHAVYSIALNASKFALVLVDTMSVKIKNNQVKNAAKDALKKTAKALEISEDELIDKIIPDLDFDKKGMRELHYGGEADRVFKLQIKNDFT
ncbi:molybdate metabolism regulator, partial [Brachyspira innocens]|uniref:molybdate metabolism regulator n=1 Tax=Brachyspira innocens TaxID=13264 RepID=UPI0026F2666C